MKKILIIFLFICTICFTGCFVNEVVPNENSITLTLDDDFASVIEGEIPSFTFNFDGNLNTIASINKSFYTVFSNNEDIILSDALIKLFDQYKDRLYIDVKSKQTVDTVFFSTLDADGNVKNLKYTPDNKEVFVETAFISLENGLKLTVDYSRFVYNGKQYYTWAHTNSITMYLYYPMMAIENGLKNKLVLITLPNRVTYSVGPSLDLSNVLNGVSYIDDDDCLYYTFKYITDLNGDGKDETLQEQQQYVIDYYVNEYNGSYKEYIVIEDVVENDQVVKKEVTKKEITYSYLGNNFIVEIYEKNFKMHHLESK